ncbi:hypothetical protein [Mycolicibacterium arseniciresistens]|uniref:Uncharacterized protein n=1 Tax=Mycolicibacterium arseniciresistens TaxID=3062257 RepID=A0ABT8UE86_9MYCO|nr:hypothetical protein [Mycolicibacterium arseniciresistens]MDO3635170.1 hypothetical protein [Mycolicibacterium arseniciresistens]
MLLSLIAVSVVLAGWSLLAFNTLSDTAEHEVLLAMVITVLGSVVLHGLGAPAAARAHARSGDREHSAPGRLGAAGRSEATGELDWSP